MPARILIVEDDPSMAAFLAEGLAVLQAEIALAEDGFQALEALRRQPPDLIILDIMLPGMGGWELARRIRGQAATQTTPILVCTARQTGPLPAGLVQGLLHKPFDLDELRRLTRAALHHG